MKNKVTLEEASRAYLEELGFQLFPRQQWTIKGNEDGLNHATDMCVEVVRAILQKKQELENAHSNSE